MFKLEMPAASPIVQAPELPGWPPAPIWASPALPTAPRGWASAAERLVQLARRASGRLPSWHDQAPYRASVEARTDSNINHLVDKISLAGDRPALCFHLTLAGWGQVRLGHSAPMKLSPGYGFFAPAGTATASLRLPAESPGWLFARLEVHHPYLGDRLAQKVASDGPVLQLEPDEAMSLAMLRLVSGDLANEFPDHFAAELALFEFVMAYERRARRLLTGHDNDERLLHEVRQLVLEALPRAIEVTAVAKSFGMSRSHFSRYFHARTGKSPAHFATLVRLERAEAMLLGTNEPLKVIADSCGFANANHLCKVFRRIRHSSPAAFRKSHRSVAASQPG